MRATLEGRKYFLVMVFMLATFVFFARAGSSDIIEDPKFTYHERMRVEITFQNGANCILYVCCTDPKLNNTFLEKISCGHISPCVDGYIRLLSCETYEQQVSCHINRVIENLTIKSYVARVDGNRTVASSGIATYVTNFKQKIPKSVSNVAVTTNANQGLTIKWDRLTARDYSSDPRTYSYVVDCKPVENKRAKAVRVDVELISDSKLVIDSRNLTAVCKYRCCVQVVNVVTSLGSELSCQSVTTTEQAPSAPPVIVCGNDTACPSVIKGMQRNITVLFKPPAVGKRNGRIVRHEVYYKNATAVSTTKFVVHNGSATEALITNAETGTSYVLYMRSCTQVGCSPVSNTVRIPAVSFHSRTSELPVVVIVGIVASICAVVLIVIGFVLKRRQNQQSKAPLETLGQEPSTVYENAENILKDDVYHELECEFVSDVPDVKDDKDCTIMSNRQNALTAC